MKDATYGQGLATASVLAKCFPRHISHQRVQEIIDDEEFLRRFLGGIGLAYQEWEVALQDDAPLSLEEALRQAEEQKLPMPAIGEVFELTLNADEIDVTSFWAKCEDGYGPWTFRGHRLFGTITRKFRWVLTGCGSTLDGVRRGCRKHGRVPEGQWIDAVRTTFKNNGRWRAIADAAWLDQRGFYHFPCIGTDDNPLFLWEGFRRRDDVRWLVEVDEPAQDEEG